MRLAAVFTFVLSCGFVFSRAFEQRRLVAPDKTQHVIGGGASSAQHRRPLPITLAHPEDGGFQTGFVAFGDSYSAGIGTGFHGKEDDCRRGLGAHAELIRADLEASQGGPNSTAFQFLSCTGATTRELISGGPDSQVDAFNASLPADFALLSVGGNDLGFFAVMNACVFRFYNFYSGTCAAALADARAQIEGDEFEERLRVAAAEVLDAVRWEKRPWFSITVTGYARFFDDATDACDDMSFGVWWDGPKLTRGLRAEMNAMVLAVNAKVRRTVDAVNARFTRDKLVFVDYDAAFDGHRFCEEGVAEPDYGRADTWFFLVGGRDNARNGTAVHHQQSRHASSDLEILAPNSVLVDPSSCLGPAQRSGDWGELALCYMTMAKARDPSLRLAAAAAAHGNLAAENSMWYVPTYYGKTFHPRSRGHEAIRDKIYEVWRGLE
ncbi:SGNH hydrolase [Hypoxylon rubiginosum]|uniref:SGNH hydrolase n=1 Tax=Hypoxylon rubiginosum TaxID=110542 RepID=A0ACB9Z774_9PEZI|nr:SGNH hydrolase [Hypoxylon rubiginosum]